MAERTYTLWHRILGRLLELLLTPLGIGVITEAQVGSNPPKTDILLLRRLTKLWTAEQLAFLPDGVRDSKAAHHLLECKLSESLNEESFQQALTYDFLYRQNQQLHLHDVQTYVLSAHTPRQAHLQMWGYTQTEHPGVYRSSLPLFHRVTLLILNELRPEPHNEFLRIFASRKRIRKSAFEWLWQRATTWSVLLWTVIVGLQKLYNLGEDEMKPQANRKIIDVDDVIKLGEEVRREFVTMIPPAERLAGMAPAERVAGLAPAERVAGLAPAERLAGLSNEDMQSLMKEIEGYLARESVKSIVLEQALLHEKRQTLLRGLQQKFGELSHVWEQRIAETTDLAQLSAWIDLAFAVQSLDAFGKEAFASIDSALP